MILMLTKMRKSTIFAKMSSVLDWLDSWRFIFQKSSGSYGHFFDKIFTNFLNRTQSKKRESLENIANDADIIPAKVFWRFLSTFMLLSWPSLRKKTLKKMRWLTPKNYFQFILLETTQ